MNKKGIDIDLPCGGSYVLKNVVLDLNGTLALDGKMLDGVEERLVEVAKKMNVYILTADTHQTADTLFYGQAMDIVIEKLCPDCGDFQKLEFITRLGRDATAAIGNGRNDVLMLREAAISICIIGREGAASQAVQNSKIVLNDIRDALDLFLKPNRIIATMRE
ncbi:MAG: ATPase P [Pseudomonadota bacterium]